MQFLILVPKSLDPAARGSKMPVPDPRPSEKIAKLFPQVDPLKDQPKDQKKPSDTSVAVPPQASAAAAAAKPVPLPEARPDIKPAPEGRRHRYRRVNHYRRRR
jgi:membrane-bound lytic murein transglycosylase A